MAVTIDATVAGAAANCYVTLAEAEAWFAQQLSAAEWTAATSDQKAQALISATGRLDQVPWNGQQANVVDPAQALKWPRYDTYDSNGWLIDSDEIPPELKRATYKLALALLREDLLQDTGLEAFEAVTVGPLQVTPRSSRQAGMLPADVQREIAPFVSIPASGFRIERG